MSKRCNIKSAAAGLLRPIGVRHYKSIGHIIRFELALLKLCGGFLFAERHNKWARAAYKLAMFVLAGKFLFDSLGVYERLASNANSDSTTQNIKLLWRFHALALGCAMISTFFSALRHHRLLSIVLDKRLDRRYLDGLILGPPRFGSASLSSSSLSPSSSRPSPEPGLELGIKSKPTAYGRVAQFREDFQRRTLQLGAIVIDRISTVRIVRFLIVANVLFAALIAVLRNENERIFSDQERLVSNGTSQNSWLPPGDDMAPLNLSTTPASPPHSPPSLVPVASREPARARTFNSKSREATGQIAHGDVERSLRLLWTSTMRLFRLGPTFLVGFVQWSFCILYLYGHFIVSIFILAAITDMLRRVGEQESAKERWYHAHLLGHKQGAKVPFNESAGVESDPERISQLATVTTDRHQRLDWIQRDWDSQYITLMPTTELLIHVRDVLLALRSALSLDYLFTQVYDISRLMAMFSMFTTFMANERYDWVVVLTIDYLRLIIVSLLPRLSYHWLHDEARKICSINERRLVESALSSYTVAGTAASHASSAVTQGRSQASVKAGADTSNLMLDRVTHLEAATNYRLAKEIENLWPTDWFTPDLKSFLSQNIFAITFVATLQQMVEASVKVESKKRMVGVGV